MKLHPAIAKVLEDTGLPWSIEQGSKHRQLRLGGRLAAILHHGKNASSDSRTIKNTVAQIRRTAAEIKENLK